MAGTIRVVTYGELWAVKRQGTDEPLSVHNSQAAAEVAGRLQARADGVDFELHDQQGTAREPHGDDS